MAGNDKDSLRANMAASLGGSSGVRPAPTAAAAKLNDPRHDGTSRSRDVLEIATDRIGPDPDQPREEFDPVAIGRLAESLKAKGQIQPIRVRWDAVRGQYVIVCGERRWRAASLAGLTTMQCVVMDGPAKAAELLGLQLIENLLREDLKPIEQARAFRAMIEANGWSASQLARELAIEQSSVARALALLKLPGEVQVQVDRGELVPTTAYEISKLDAPALQVEVAGRVVAEGLKTADVARVVRNGKAKGRGASKPRKVTERTFRTTAGPRVTVEFKRGLDPDLMVAAMAEAIEQILRAAGEVAA